MRVRVRAGMAPKAATSRAHALARRNRTVQACVRSHVAMRNFETVLTLLVGVTLLALVARRFQLPTPALLVVGGLLVAVVPGLPTVQFDPQLVFLIFIPPLLYSASLLSSYRDVRANFRPILSLGVGHVVFATIVIAWVAHNAIPGLPWASAFALGAVASPPDVAAATAVLRRPPMPRRVVTILQGESMINDAAAIVAYRVAVAAAVTGAFSLMGAAGRFVVVGTGGVLVGLAVGWLLAAVRRRIHDPEVENTISLLSGYAAYLPAEHFGVSGVLAVVSMGLYLGRVGPRFVAADTRVQNAGMWDVVVFVLEGLIFILTGLALRPIVEGLTGAAALELARAAVLVSLAVVIARLLWVYFAGNFRWLLGPRLRPREPRPRWQVRSEEHTSELQSRLHLVCRLLLEKKKDELLRLNPPAPDGAARHATSLIGTRSYNSLALGAGQPPNDSLQRLATAHTVALPADARG